MLAVVYDDGYAVMTPNRLIDLVSWVKVAGKG